MRNNRSILSLTLLALALPALAACGAGGYVDGGGYVPIGAPIGTVYAENSTLSVPSTVMYDFVLWPSYVAPSGENLLPYPLEPGEYLAVADVDEDTYDAESLMSDGAVDYLETWYDVFVPGETDTTFFAY